MKEKTGEKCTQKKKKSRNEKNRTSEKKESGRKLFFGQSESELLLHRAMWYLQVGSFFFFFFSYIYSSNWRDCNFMSQVRKPLDPNFPSHFFSLTKYTKILFSLLFYFFPSFLKSIQPNKLVLKSHPFLSINGILE